MFEQSMLNGARKGKRAVSLMISSTAQIAIVGALLLTPMIYTESMPAVRIAMKLPPLPTQRPAAEAPRTTLQRASSSSARVFQALHMPSRIPDRILILEESAPDQPFGSSTPIQSIDAPAGSCCGAVGTDVSATPVWQAPKQEPPARKPPSTPQPVGGDVQRAKLVMQPLPIYPQLARQARISGVVKLIGIIGKDGTIQQLRVISGHPLLVGAALDAVRRWTYRPTLLNGQPVDVIAPIDVNFTLSR